MNRTCRKTCIAFKDSRCIASGELTEVIQQVKAALGGDDHAPVFIFDHHSSEPIEVDFRGTMADILKRLPPAPADETEHEEPAPDMPRGPGRPRLGVVAREITMLPRHWNWLNSQPGGASVALRKLVEEAMRSHSGRDRIRKAQEAANRFLFAMAGNLTDVEEVTRALFAGDHDRFSRLMDPWPPDIRAHALKLAEPAFHAQV